MKKSNIMFILAIFFGILTIDTVLTSLWEAYNNNIILFWFCYGFMYVTMVMMFFALYDANKFIKRESKG